MEKTATESGAADFSKPNWRTPSLPALITALEDHHHVLFVVGIGSGSLLTSTPRARRHISSSASATPTAITKFVSAAGCRRPATALRLAVWGILGCRIEIRPRIALTSSAKVAGNVVYWSEGFPGGQAGWKWSSITHCRNRSVDTGEASSPSASRKCPRDRSPHREGRLEAFADHQDPGEAAIEPAFHRCAAMPRGNVLPSLKQ